MAPNVKMSKASNTRVRQSSITMVFVRKTRQNNGSRVRRGDTENRKKLRHGVLSVL